jgi:hypothetical protein
MAGQVGTPKEKINIISVSSGKSEIYCHVLDPCVLTLSGDLNQKKNTIRIPIDRERESIANKIQNQEFLQKNDIQHYQTKKCMNIIDKYWCTILKNQGINILFVPTITCLGYLTSEDNMTVLLRNFQTSQRNKKALIETMGLFTNEQDT